MELSKRCLINSYKYINNNILFRHYCASQAPSKELQKDVHRAGQPYESRDWPERVVAGLQPTGALHLGNYFAVLQRCAAMSRRGQDLSVFIADLHALTVPQEASSLRANSLEAAASLWAVLGEGGGEGAVVFEQSQVPRHAELCWVLACLSSVASVAGLPQLREKRTDRGWRLEQAPLGLMLYPVLQAADVLACRGTHVLVGRDQIPHIQLAQKLARAFRSRHEVNLFPEPEALLPEEGAERVLSLRDPTKKMSKSDPDPNSRVLMTDSPEQITRKVRRALTDCRADVSFEPATRPGVSGLVTLHCLATGSSSEQVVASARGLSTAQYKVVVADALAEHLAPVRERILRARADPQLLRDWLQHGASLARSRADKVWEEVRCAVGLSERLVRNLPRVPAPEALKNRS